MEILTFFSKHLLGSWEETLGLFDALHSFIYVGLAFKIMVSIEPK